jgi:hypothetical protein
MKLTTTINIEAAPADVWAILADLDAYASWNPFIRSAAGEVAVGERLDIHVQPESAKGMRFRPTVRAAEPGRELRWLGRLLLPGVFDGEHRFALEPIASGCRLTHEERFTGVLVPLFAKRLRQRYLPAFEAMNRAVKERAEHRLVTAGR